jgi:hypothetical protein
MQVYGEIVLKDTDKKSLKYGEYEVEFEKIFEEGWRVSVKRENELLRTKVLLMSLENITLRDIPAYLDLPVILSFENPIVLSPQGRLSIFATLPIQIEIIALILGEEITIEKLEPLSIKQAWFGQPHEGTLSYYFDSKIVHSPKDWKSETGEALVPLRVRNYDSELRTIEKILVDSYQLSIFKYENRLISEVVELSVKDGGIDIDYTDEPPFPGLVEVKKGEESAKRKKLVRFARRSLGKLTGGIIPGL